MLRDVGLRVERERGLASSAWHINDMGPPYRSDAWAWAQSSVRWWSFLEGRWVASSARHLSMRWGRLIARTFEHGHRAVCGGGLFGVVVDVEVHVFVADFLVDKYL